ncbi:MAG TPA: hypothetical protein O0X99_01565 [Methanocorpusculum sp.]|nr:hypothetical protein [Methanocorpusculum sp.]
MKLAGDITAIIGQRLIIVKSDAGQLPPLYVDVANEDNLYIGKIVDLYGNISEPYLTVLCDNGATPHIGDRLYVIPDQSPNSSHHRSTSTNNKKGKIYGKRIRTNQGIKTRTRKNKRVTK